MLLLFNKLFGIPLAWLANLCMAASCWFLGEGELEKLGYMERIDDESDN